MKKVFALMFLFTFYTSSHALDEWDPMDDLFTGATDLGTPTTEVQIHGPHIIGTDEQYVSDPFDWFKFYLEEGIEYAFSSTSIENDIGIAAIFKQEQTQLVKVIDVGAKVEGESSVREDFTLQFTPSISNLYYLAIPRFGRPIGLDGLSNDDTTYQLLYVRVTPDSPSTPTPIPTPTATPLPPVDSSPTPIGVEFQVLDSTFNAEVFAVLEHIPGDFFNQIVLGRNNDFILATKETPLHDTNTLVWYAGETKSEIIRTDSGVTIRGLAYGGLNSFLVVINNKNENNWKIYKVNGMFEPASIKQFSVY